MSRIFTSMGIWIRRIIDCEDVNIHTISWKVSPSRKSDSFLTTCWFKQTIALVAEKFSDRRKTLNWDLMFLNYFLYGFLKSNVLRSQRLFHRKKHFEPWMLSKAQKCFCAVSAVLCDISIANVWHLYTRTNKSYWRLKHFEIVTWFS